MILKRRQHQQQQQHEQRYSERKQTTRCGMESERASKKLAVAVVEISDKNKSDYSIFITIRYTHTQWSGWQWQADTLRI
jgi:hypothetical protein